MIVLTNFNSFILETQQLDEKVSISKQETEKSTNSSAVIATSSKGVIKDVPVFPIATTTLAPAKKEVK